MEDSLPVLLAGTVGGIQIYEFDGEYEVYEGDHCTIFEDELEAWHYYNKNGGATQYTLLQEWNSCMEWMAENIGVIE